MEYSMQRVRPLEAVADSRGGGTRTLRRIAASCAVVAAVVAITMLLSDGSSEVSGTKTGLRRCRRLHWEWWTLCVVVLAPKCAVLMNMEVMLGHDRASMQRRCRPGAAPAAASSSCWPGMRAFMQERERRGVERCPKEWGTNARQILCTFLIDVRSSPILLFVVLATLPRAGALLSGSVHDQGRCSEVVQRPG